MEKALPLVKRGRETPGKQRPSLMGIGERAESDRGKQYYLRNQQPIDE